MVEYTPNMILGNTLICCGTLLLSVSAIGVRALSQSKSGLIGIVLLAIPLIYISSKSHSIQETVGGKDASDIRVQVLSLLFLLVYIYGFVSTIITRNNL
jgi:hypothetical protein